MLDILLYWAGKGVDGFRCDMAEMVPAAFWAWATKAVREQYPDIVFIGEVYNPAEYRHYLASGFDYLYDKVGMYDTLCAVLCHRCGTDAITHAWQQTDDIRNHMLYFLENHDEQRLASDFIVGQAEKALPAVVVAALLQQNPFMLYNGQEWGERGMDAAGFSGSDGRTTIFDYWSLLADRDTKLSDYYQRLLNIARKEKAVAEGLMFDLMYVNQQYYRQYAFIRKADRQMLLIVANFDDVPVTMSLTIPSHAFDYLKLKEGEFESVDLLTGKPLRLTLRRDATVSCRVPARGAVMLKTKF